MAVNLGMSRFLLPRFYTIRNRDSLKYILLNWSLEGSIDETNWYVLDQRIHTGPKDSQLLEKKENRLKIM